MPNLRMESTDDELRPRSFMDQHFERNVGSVGYTCRECGAAVRTADAGRTHQHWHERLERRLPQH